MRHLTTSQCYLNRNQLKYLVIFAMLIDHIAWAFVPMDSVLGQAMHFIGRLTGPTMAYFVAEGYSHTRNVKKYALRLGIFALLSWLPFSYFESGTIGLHFGVIYTLFLGLLAIWLWDKGRCTQEVKLLGVFGLCALSVLGDWPVFDVLFCLLFFVFRENPRKKWTAFCAVALVCCLNVFYSDPWWSGLFMLGIFCVPLLLHFFYHGKNGSKKPFHKWFFYVFYPAHLLVLAIIRELIYRF